MITVFRPKAERFFLLSPLIVSFQNDNTPILNDINKHPFIEQLFYPTIDHHCEFIVVSPLHVSQLSALFILKLLVIYFLLLVLLYVESIRLYDRYVCGRADVVWTCMHLFVCASFGTRYLKQSVKWQSLKDSSTHLSIKIYEWCALMC